jgi:hypothetical protein
MPINRQTPLKQNIRVWFNYLKIAIEKKYEINKEYYRAWHLPQVRTLSFDKWWKTHKQLFVHKQFINLRVLNELTLNQAMQEVKKQLIGKVDQKSNFHISSKKFHYQAVDDFLKCWKLRQTLVYSKRFKEMRPMSYLNIAHKIRYDYIKKAPLYEDKIVEGKKVKSKLLKRNFKAITKRQSQRANVLHSVKKRVNNAEKIIINTAKGQFTGKY